MNRFHYLMSYSSSAAVCIEERAPRLLGLLVCADELQLGEVPLNGLNERVNQRIGGRTLWAQDCE